MKYFARVVMEKQDIPNALHESVIPNIQIFESDLGTTIMEFPLAGPLDEVQSNLLAETLSNYLFDQGHTDFDIEISADVESIDEETYDGDDFFEEYGVMWYDESGLNEAEYQGRSVALGKPSRSKNGPKKFHVFVKDPATGNVKKVNFGDPNMTIKKSNPERRRSFRARHRCDTPGPKTKARFWSCKKW